MSKNIFTRKQYGGSLYKWSPDNSLVKQCIKCNNDIVIINNKCKAIKFTQGEDWVTGYCYDLTFSGGQYHRLAYVECDYVE